MLIYLCSTANVSHTSNFDVSRVESVLLGLNPEFGMHESEPSSDDSSTASISDDDSDTR